MKAIASVLIAVSFAFAAHAVDESSPVTENLREHENTEWSQAYAYHMIDASKSLPRVLLVGDSICRGYEGNVRKLLEGKVNVSFWASSYCVTSPNYLRLLSFYLDEAKYDVIHFNNGLHSLSTPNADWEKGIKAALALIRQKQPNAKLIWCASTPLKDPNRTAKAKELNAIAAKEAVRLGIPVNDLFALLDPLDRDKNWSDVYHHKPHLRAKEAAQIAKIVLSALGRK